MELSTKKTSIVFVPTVNWSTDNNKEVEFYFNEHIMPYLIEFNNSFTQYDILELKDMMSQDSIILYKWLVMEHKKRLSKAKNEINKSNKNGVGNTSLLVEYEPIKHHNSKIVSIKFMVRKRNSAMDHDFSKLTQKNTESKHP